MSCAQRDRMNQRTWAARRGHPVTTTGSAGAGPPRSSWGRLGSRSSTRVRDQVSTPPTLMLVPLRESAADDRLPPDAGSGDWSPLPAALRVKVLNTIVRPAGQPRARPVPRRPCRRRCLFQPMRASPELTYNKSIVNMGQLHRIRPGLQPGGPEVVSFVGLDGSPRFLGGLSTSR